MLTKIGSKLKGQTPSLLPSCLQSLETLIEQIAFYAANFSWASFSCGGARRIFVAMASFESMVSMRTIGGTIFPGMIVPIRLSHSGGFVSSASRPERLLNLPASVSPALPVLAACAATREQKKVA